MNETEEAVARMFARAEALDERRKRLDDRRAELEARRAALDERRAELDEKRRRIDAGQTPTAQVVAILQGMAIGLIVAAVVLPFLIYLK